MGYLDASHVCMHSFCCLNVLCTVLTSTTDMHRSFVVGSRVRTCMCLHKLDRQAITVKGHYSTVNVKLLPGYNILTTLRIG